jgi:hypothetical protein
MLVLVANVVSAQSWTVYEGDVDPLSFSPAFEVTQQTNAINQIVADPSNANNSLLQMTTALVTDNNQWRQPTSSTDITIVLKAKTIDVAKNLLFDLDIRNGAAGRYSLRVLNDGTYNVASGGSGTGPLGHDATEWNTYRFTKSGQNVAVYLNEDPTPVFTAVSTSTSDGTNNYVRFGDGWGSGNIDTQIDWVAWDFSGAYSPSDFALPAGLTQTPLGDWTIYNADVDPLSFSPAFEVTQQTNAINEIIADPDRAGNNLLRMATVLTADNNQWRQPTAATDVTMVLKAKSVDVGGKNLLFDMDIRNGATGRFAIQVLTDGTYNIAQGGSGNGVLGHVASEWTIFRVTKSSQQIAIYLDEDPTPVFTATSTSTSDGTNNYIRFGDGWGSGNIDTHIDWAAWDFSGAYSPTQTRLPDELIKAPLGDWTVYEADVDPLSFTPSFEVTQQTNAINEIIVDPSDPSNNLLRMATVAVTDNNQWRQPTSATDITVVLKAKTADITKNLLFDMDIRNGAVGRYSLRVLNDGTYSVASGGSETGALGHNPSDWTIFRFTKSGQNVAVYLDENPTPVFTATSTSTSDGTNNYFRFGDGWGSGNIDTHIDWVVWDFSGAYSPYQTRLPDELTGGEVPNVPSISTLGAVGPLSQDLGFPSDFTTGSYTVSGSDLTGDVTITPPVNFEVSIDETNWSTNASPLVLSQTDGTIESTTIFVKLNAATVGDYSGDISHTSAGAEEKTVAVSGSTVDLIPEITLTGSLNDFVQNLSSPSASQNYRVSGVNLKGAITVTAPTDFEVSADDATWQSSIVLDPTNRTISNAFVYVRLAASALGSYSGAISHTATDASTVTQNVTGDVIPDPGITITGQFTNFTQALGVPSAAQSYTVSGSNLASGIVITLPEGYEISFTGDFWLNSLTLNPLDGNVSTITLFVRLNAQTVGPKNGDIVHASTGISSVVRAVTGNTSELTLSIGDERSMNLWPNPSSDRITLDRKSHSNEGRVEVFSLEGKLMSSYSFEQGNTSLEIDINALPKGLYLIKYEDAEGIARQKFVKE